VAADYIDAMQRARERYGDRTLVSMQVGSFYEVYATVVAVGDAKKPVYSAGIPLESLSRYRSMLMEKKFAPQRS
jgi:DNA mismatch repair ATPase MutS